MPEQDKLELKMLGTSDQKWRKQIPRHNNIILKEIC